MCPPDHYGIEYEINPWMSRQRQADRRWRSQQWRGLHEILLSWARRFRCSSRSRAARPGLHGQRGDDLSQRRAILSHFRHQQRQGEEPLRCGWLAEHGFTVERLPEGRFFEGAGDALFCGETLIAGYRIRSDVREPADARRRCSAARSCRWS